MCIRDRCWVCWIVRSRGNTTTFSNLEPGRYQVEFAVYNSLGLSNFVRPSNVATVVQGAVALSTPSGLRALTSQFTVGQPVAIAWNYSGRAPAAFWFRERSPASLAPTRGVQPWSIGRPFRPHVSGSARQGNISDIYFTGGVNGSRFGKVVLEVQVQALASNSLQDLETGPWSSTLSISLTNTETG